MVKRRKNIADRKIQELEKGYRSTVRSGIIAASKAMPLCAPAIRGLHIVLDDTVGSMGIDKYWRCYVAPSFLDMCEKLAKEVSVDNPCESCGTDSHHPIAYIGGVLCHEAWHLLRVHWERAENNDVFNQHYGLIWNVAADMEINDGLLECFKTSDNLHKLCMPPTNFILPSSQDFEDGKLTETYYYDLKTKVQKHQKKCKTCNGVGEVKESKGAGEAKEGKGNTPSGNSKNQSTTCPDCGGSGKESLEHILGKSDGGSGVDNLPRAYDKGEPGPNNKQSGLSSVEARMIRKEVARQIQKSGKRGGSVPGGWKLWANEELEPPKYNWHNELRKVIGRVLHNIPGDMFKSYRRLNRRFSYFRGKVIMPSFYNTIPQVCIIQDTSGSMGHKDLKISLEETQGILKTIKANVTYINCDTGADKQQNITKVKDISLHGGGGTDMRNGIAAAVESYPSPDVIILFTDGITPWPAEPIPTGKQLVVCLVGEEACDSNAVPAWCRVIKIIDEVVDVREAVC